MIGFENVNVAVRVSWASRRYTTRTEDIAYCLMGLFGVRMPLLHGEGRMLSLDFNSRFSRCPMMRQFSPGTTTTSSSFCSALHHRALHQHLQLCTEHI
jgi:hypothetical protein